MNSFSFGSANSSTLSLAPNLTSTRPIAAAAPPNRLKQALVAPGTGVNRLQLAGRGRL